MAVDIGDTVHIGGTCRAADGTPVNATTVTLTIQLPDGTTTSPVVANPPTVTGEYGIDYVPTVEGRHQWWLRTTGPATALTGVVDVRPSFPGYVVSVADAKAHLGKAAASSGDDEELRGFIEATTLVVERLAGRTVGRRARVERHHLDRRVGAVALWHVPVISLTEVVTVDGATTWAVADLDVDPDTGIVAVLRGPALYGRLRITYVAGYQVVPANLTTAALMVVAHMWETQRARLGGRRGGFGGQSDDTVMVAGYAVPRAAVEMIGPPLPGVA